jgi:hypothetical protein
MKKIIGLMLGLSLLTGVATTAFGQTDTNKQKSKSSKKKKKGTNSTNK